MHKTMVITLLALIMIIKRHLLEEKIKKTWCNS